MHSAIRNGDGKMLSYKEIARVLNEAEEERATKAKGEGQVNAQVYFTSTIRAVCFRKLWRDEIFELVVEKEEKRVAEDEDEDEKPSVSRTSFFDT